MGRNSRVVILAVYMACVGALPARGWNAAGHKVIAEVAWRSLDARARQAVLALIHCHPRFALDFKAPQSVPRNQWIFQEASAWPCRAEALHGKVKRRFHWPTWHVAAMPLHLTGNTEATFSLRSVRVGRATQWNTLQAADYCHDVLEHEYDLRGKALAICWLMHLVGDVHQPTHSRSAYSARCPGGDDGGSHLLCSNGVTLLDLWDQSLGADEDFDAVNQVVDQVLTTDILGLSVAADWEQWNRESHELARTSVYPPEIAAALAVAGDQPLGTSPAYEAELRRVALRQAHIAGLRLASLLAALNAPVDKPPVDLPKADAKRSLITEVFDHPIAKNPVLAGMLLLVLGGFLLKQWEQNRAARLANQANVSNRAQAAEDLRRAKAADFVQETAKLLNRAVSDFFSLARYPSHDESLRAADESVTALFYHRFVVRLSSDAYLKPLGLDFWRDYESLMQAMRRAVAIVSRAGVVDHSETNQKLRDAVASCFQQWQTDDPSLQVETTDRANISREKVVQSWRQLAIVQTEEEATELASEAIALAQLLFDRTAQILSRALSTAVNVATTSTTSP